MTDPKQVETEFRKEFAALMRKYKISEITVREDFCGYQTTVEGIEFDFDGIYSEDHELIRPWFIVDMGTYITPDLLDPTKV